MNPFAHRNPKYCSYENIHVTQAIWDKLATLDETTIYELYFVMWTHPRYWEIFSNLEKPDWWTGDLIDDPRHGWYGHPIHRFVDRHYLGKNLTKYCFTQHLKDKITEDEFEEKWKAGEYFNVTDQSYYSDNIDRLLQD